MGRKLPKVSAFRWTEKAVAVAFSLAEGAKQIDAAEKAGVSDRTIRNWLQQPEFAEEVDRLTFLTGVALKAERLRIAKRVIAKLEEKTQRDLLDWLKYAQGETDGIKLDFAELFAAIHADGEAVAPSRPGSSTHDSE
jgi:hypothetical protein